MGGMSDCPVPEGREQSSLGLGLVPEGQECPTCKRRVPKAKKNTSPDTKTFSFRIPVDDVETFREQLRESAKNVGLYEKSHWQYWTVLRGLVHVLQEPFHD